MYWIIQFKDAAEGLLNSFEDGLAQELLRNNWIVAMFASDGVWMLKPSEE